MTFSTSSHAKFYHRYHLTCSTKYRRPILTGQIRDRVGESFIETCAELDVPVLHGILSTDHVHLFLSVPPKLALSGVVQRLKGRSSRVVRLEFPFLQAQISGHFWSKGFFSATSGYVTEQTVQTYLDQHVHRDPNSTILPLLARSPAQ